MDKEKADKNFKSLLLLVLLLVATSALFVVVL